MFFLIADSLFLRKDKSLANARDKRLTGVILELPALSEGEGLLSLLRSDDCFEKRLRADFFAELIR